MKLIPPREPAPYHGVRVSAYDKAKEAATEKLRSQYIHLKCDHYTTWEMDEYYSDLRPSRKKHWCDKCGKWIEKMPKPIAPTYNEPMF